MCRTQLSFTYLVIKLRVIIIYFYFQPLRFIFKIVKFSQNFLFSQRLNTFLFFNIFSVFSKSVEKKLFLIGQLPQFQKFCLLQSLIMMRTHNETVSENIIFRRIRGVAECGLVTPFFRSGGPQYHLSPPLYTHFFLCVQKCYFSIVQPVC